MLKFQLIYHQNIIGKKIIVSVSADAIQSENFNPDYSLEDPWNGVKVAKSINNSYGIDVDDKKVDIESIMQKTTLKFLTNFLVS